VLFFELTYPKMSVNKYRKMAEENPNIPQRIGMKWEESEEQELLKMLQLGINIPDIASGLNRTVGGIQSRIRFIVHNLYITGSSTDEISQRVGLTVEDVIDIIEYRDKSLESAVSRKQQEKEKSKDERLLDVMKEIRDLMRILVNKL
jgi:hypothetical protein